MADFNCWKIENLVAFCEAASARLKEVDKRIATERQLAYEWGFSDGVDSCRQGASRSGGAIVDKNSSSLLTGNV